MKDFNQEPLLETTRQTIALPLDQIQGICYELRKGTFEVCLDARNGHLGGSSSSVELMGVLYFGGILKYDPTNLQHPDRDRVLVRGHLGPLRYKIFSLLGHVSDDELKTYRELGSRLQGHEEWQEMPGVDITPSGSLGMLLSYGVGASIAAKDQGKDFKTYVFLGDGEEQEGNVSEAARHASNLGLNNLVTIIDANGKQLSRPVSDNNKNEDLATIWKGYGWDVIELEDGHDIHAIQGAYKKLDGQTRPTVIIAKTIKGIGLEGAKEHFCGYHTLSSCTPTIVASGIETQKQLLADVGLDIETIKGYVSPLLAIPWTTVTTTKYDELIVDVEPDEDVPNNPQDASSDYFAALRKVIESGRNLPPIYFLTADVTRKDYVADHEMDKYMRLYDVGIREQHMMAMAHGLSLTHPHARIFLNTLDAFVYRSLDQLNSLIQGQGRVIILSDAAGLTNDRNGKTHQSSGQPGGAQTLPGLTFLEPADTKDTYNCLNWAFTSSDGAVMVRTFKGEVPVFEAVMGYQRNLVAYPVFNPTRKPDVIVIGSGLTVGSSVQAAQSLENEGVSVRVVNVVNPNTLGEEFVSTLEAGVPVVTIYNGSGKVLQSQVARAILEVGKTFPSRVIGHGFEYGTSGRLKDLMRYFGIDKDGVIKLVKQVTK